MTSSIQGGQGDALTGTRQMVKDSGEPPSVSRSPSPQVPGERVRGLGGEVGESMAPESLLFSGGLLWGSHGAGAASAG